MTLTSSNISLILPLTLTAATPVLVMLSLAIKRHHGFCMLLATSGLLVALLSLFSIDANTPTAVTSLLVVDRISWFFSALILFCALISLFFSYHYMRGFTGNKEELYLLLTVSCTGALVMVSSQHMATVFLGLEILTVPLYGLVAYTFRSGHSLEAAIKYLILSATATAFLLFGMALLYAQTGTLSFSGLAATLSASNFSSSPLLLTGSAMLLIGLAFKLSFAPFHFWTPDVYQGAPAPVGGFLASASKVAAFAVLMRFLLETPVGQQASVANAFIVIAILSILFGNLLALQQANLKRLLAYSSIAHFGYLLIALVANNALSKEAVNLYLLVYALTTLGCFGVISLVSSPFSGQDKEHLSAYRGLFWHSPALAVVFAIMMLSLAGIPLTAGFMAKFFVISSGVDAHLWLLLSTLIIGSAIGIYYYLRVIITLFMNAPTKITPTYPAFGLNSMLLSVLALAVLYIGIFPQTILQWLQTTGFVAL